jgi:hypothetical protein
VTLKEREEGLDCYIIIFFTCDRDVSFVIEMIGNNFTYSSSLIYWMHFVKLFVFVSTGNKCGRCEIDKPLSPISSVSVDISHLLCCRVA